MCVVNMNEKLYLEMVENNRLNLKRRQRMSSQQNAVNNLVCRADKRQIQTSLQGLENTRSYHRTLHAVNQHINDNLG